MTSFDRVSTKLYIPHPSEPSCSIVGILEQVSSTGYKTGSEKKIALILHGTGGHKDYLFQKRLAFRLPMDSFRFDFRGNHETPGVWRQGALAEDVVDVRVVVEYLKANYGYTVDLVVGHSRGSIVAFKWICTTEEGRKISGFVNASGRYRMSKILGKSLLGLTFESTFEPTRLYSVVIQESPGINVWQENIAKQGYHLWNVTVARKQFTAKIYREDLETFTNWDTSFVWDQFPQSVDVLTIHGLSDQVVRPYDAIIYTRALSPRTPGTTNLHLMEDADHNFTGRQDEVVGAVLEWWEAKQRSNGSLKTGVWLSGIRGKL